MTVHFRRRSAEERVQRHPQERSGRPQSPNELEHRGDKEMSGKEQMAILDRRSILSDLKCPYQISLLLGKDGVVSFYKKQINTRASMWQTGYIQQHCLIVSIMNNFLPLSLYVKQLESG